VFYEPSDQGYEARIAERMAQLRTVAQEAHAAKTSERSGSANAGRQQEKNDNRSTDPPRGK
jgi:hypothetical protein